MFSDNFCIRTRIHTTSQHKESKEEQQTFIEANYLYFIIGGSCLLCLCIILIAYYTRKRLKNQYLEKIFTNTAPTTSNSIEIIQTPETHAIINVNSSPEISGYDEMDMVDLQRIPAEQKNEMLQIHQSQHYRESTNFTKPQNISAYQALEYAAPINHSGNHWRNLSQDPQQRMMQLMFQQRQLQQMANQAAIAMSYFLQQQKMGDSSNRNLLSNRNNYNGYMQQVGSLSSMNGHMTFQHDAIDDEFLKNTKDLPSEPSSSQENDEDNKLENDDDDEGDGGFALKNERKLLPNAGEMDDRLETDPNDMPELPLHPSIDLLFEEVSTRL